MIYPVVRLSLTAVDLPNLETVGISDPFYEVWGYDLLGVDTLLYTSEVVPNKVEFVKWKPAVFAVSKSTIFNKFKIVIYDKEMFQKDRVLAGPIDVSMNKLLKRKKSICLGVGKAFLNVNGFERL